MNRVVCVLVVLTLFCFFAISPTFIAALDTDTLPPALAPWQSWVLHGKDEMGCPAPFNDPARRICWWPSHLALDVGDQGGLFDQQITVYANTWVTLPGDATHWPESVFSDTQPLPVTNRGDRPCVWLGPGDYRIRGAFVWDPLPEMLQLPVSVALLSLKINGREVDDPDLDATGRLRLHGRDNAARGEDTITASLFRLIEDDVPMQVVTHIRLHVSGRPRELRLAVRLPDKATVMQIDSPLPARLADNGDLLVQARPGQWDVRLTERLPGPVTALSAGDGPFGEEIWSFKAYNHLRMVNITGVSPVEPSRTRMPDNWQRFPAYLMPPGARLTFNVLRRGDPAPAPDQLRLQRSWWLDFDGAGFTIHDRIEGTLSRTWHLAMAPPMELGRAAVDGKDQLITLQGDTPPSPGIQLRRGQLELEADSRLPRQSASLPAVGWGHDFQQVSGTLHLPPGWTLFSAAGVDIPPGAWLQRWTLLDFFLVLIIAISTFKLRNIKSAILILATLILIFHEAGAPRHVWLHLLVVTALLRYLPGSWFKRLIKLWGAVAVIALIIISLPFMVHQVRRAIYPQLVQTYPGIVPQPLTLGTDDFDKEARPAAPRRSSMNKRMAERTAPLTSSVSATSSAPKSHQATDPDALIQTGPGLPAWRWQSVALRWNGPVDRHQEIRLWLISPVINLLLGILRVVLLLLSIWVFLDLTNWRPRLPAPLLAGGAILPPLLLLICLTTLAAPVRAEDSSSAFPPQQLLDELGRRLLEPAPCHPHCADVSRLELAATPDELRLIMQVHAIVDTAIPLPITQDTWRPTEVKLDNMPADSLARDDQGNLWMALPQGVHRIKMTGPTNKKDEIRIVFAMVPHVGAYAGVGWKARGFLPDNTMEATIALTRMKSDNNAQAPPSRADVPAYFHLTRTLHLGIQWEVTTRIQRLTPPGQPAVLSVPLLKDASLTTEGILVEDQTAQIALAPNQTEARFSSTLPFSPSIVLTAPKQVPWTESWILDAAPLWNCTITGLTAVAHQDAARNWQPQWRPWPGEQVTITATRPKAVSGRTITIDNAKLDLTPGQRFSRSELALGIRSSKGGHHQVELPEMANLQSVTVNGAQLPIRQDGRKVSIPLEPGLQRIGLQWLEINESMTVVKGPRVHIGDAAVNAAVTIHMPGNRWILLAGGPKLGPAVLFWSYVIVVLIAAVGLGKTDLTPLRTRHWIILGLGLTQIPAPVAVLVVGWLMALGARCRKKAPDRPLVFNLMQLLLVALTVAALAGLYTAVERGLLGIPDMQIAGNHSTQTQLNWYQDRIGKMLPTPWVLSLPQWTYHLLMLAWSLWLAFSLVAWLRWGWSCFTRTHLWKPMRLRRKKETEHPQEGPASTAKVESET